MAQSTQAPNSRSSKRHDAHATGANAGGWSTRRIATCALLCAVSAVLTLFVEFPILPGVTFLKYDPSGIIALIGGFAFGPEVAIVTSVVPYLVHLVTQSGIYGTCMAIIATASMAVPASIVYKHLTTTRGGIMGLVIGGIMSIALCILGNLVVTPLYLGLPLSDVAALIIPALLPFNTLKVIINAVVCWLVYKPISKVIK